MTLGWRVRLERLRREPEGGFSLLEVTVAMGVFTVAMMLMTTMVVGGMRGVLQGKQRSAATMESNALIEMARNLQFEDVGLAPATGPDADSTISTDPLIVDQAGTLVFETDDPCNPGQTHMEPILFAQNPSGSPLNPHQKAYSVGSTSITRYVYVTGTDKDCPPDGVTDLRRVVVRSVFANPAYSAQAVPNEVRIQTFIGENSPGTPGSPPKDAILPPLAGKAVATGPRVNVLVSVGPGACIEGENCDPDALTLNAPGTTGSAIVFGYNQGMCDSTSAMLAANDEKIGNSSITVSSDDSPTTTVPEEPAGQTLPSTLVPTLNGTLDRHMVEAAVGLTNYCETKNPKFPALGSELGWANMSQSVTYSADLTDTPIGVTAATLAALSGHYVEQTIAHSGTTEHDRQITMTAREKLSDLAALKVNALGLDASRGLIHVFNHDFTARAAAKSTSPDIDPSITLAAGLSLEVFDPDQTLTTQCDNHPRLPTDTYCTLVIDVNDDNFQGMSITVSSNWEVDTAPYSFKTTLHVASKTIADEKNVPAGRIWEASWHPVTATTEIIFRLPDPPEIPEDPLATPDPNLQVTYTPYFDAQVQIDLGQIKAVGCYGPAMAGLNSVCV